MNDETIDLTAVSCSSGFDNIESVKRGAAASSFIREKFGHLYDIEIDTDMMPIPVKGGYDICTWFHVTDDEINEHIAEHAFLTKRRDDAK